MVQNSGVLAVALALSVGVVASQSILPDSIYPQINELPKEKKRPATSRDLKELLSERGKATFILKDAKGQVPEILLFEFDVDKDGEVDDPSKKFYEIAEHANSFRKNAPEIKDGLIVYFDGIRFQEEPKKPSELKVYLVGRWNEVELKSNVNMGNLLSGKTLDLEFDGKSGMYPITGTTVAKMDVRYNPQTKALLIGKIFAKFKWDGRKFSYPFERLVGEDSSDEAKNLVGTLGNLERRGDVLKQ